MAGRELTNKYKQNIQRRGNFDSQFWIKDRGHHSLYRMNSTMIHPEGFRYFDEVISEKEENEILNFVHELEFLPYVMRGQPSKRGIVRFGHDYGPVGGHHHVVRPLPPGLIWLRDRCSRIAHLSGSEFVASVITRYPPGATIGWHSDMTMFGPVVFGVSLAAPCIFKLRPKSMPKKTLSMTLEPRSLYIMEGRLRSDWEHSIPPVQVIRYSITYRTIKNS
jgi:alkylated DNA repair dioxygenase AlkB